MALGPHEVLLLVNENSRDSVEVAQEFTKLRYVPESNIVRLNLPDRVVKSPSEITPEDFAKLIWEPAVHAAKQRGIDDHILAWVYSVDFPVRIRANPVISIQGLTFLRNKMPQPDQVKRSNPYSSPLFAGPVNTKGLMHYSQTFDVYNAWLGNDMPLPNMTLGYTGKGGNSKESVLNCLRQGTASDGTAPTGTVCFIKSNDIRSTCRDWQFPLAQKTLKSLGVNSVITETFPTDQKEILGLMIGAANVDPEKGNNTFLPGSMAEHLTSFAAVFHSSNQTKLSVWVESGATASAGTVTEPFAAWIKFPSAMFFVHYASGCTMIESFYQSISCPLEIFLAGDPLARPWESKAELVLHGLKNERISGKITLSADVESKEKHYYGKFVYLLNGRVVGTNKILELDTAALENGEHILRVVGYRTGMVRDQVFEERKIEIRNSGRRN
ncbi:TIGR03790 family protein [Verrucomicrobiota bacterium]